MDGYAMCKDDPYLISGPECLVNILRITDIEELERAEREISDSTSNRIQKQTPPYGLDTMTYITPNSFWSALCLGWESAHSGHLER